MSDIRIAGIDISNSGNIQRYRIVYDVYGNVDSFVVTGGGFDTGYNGFNAFNYIGSSWTITDQNNYTFRVDGNTNGDIIGVLVTDTLSMIYNGSELSVINIKSPIPAYPYDSLSSIQYTWLNGDVSMFMYPGVTQSYDYDQSRGGQIGDAIRVQEFLTYGRPFIKTSHMPKDLNSGGQMTEQYLYQYDGSGRISQLQKIKVDHTGGNNDTTTYNYHY